MPGTTLIATDSALDHSQGTAETYILKLTGKGVENCEFGIKVCQNGCVNVGVNRTYLDKAESKFLRIICQNDGITTKDALISLVNEIDPGNNAPIDRSHYVFIDRLNRNLERVCLRVRLNKNYGCILDPLPKREG